ncbi:HNH endonuclease [Paraburkholderia sp. BR14320]|uniref:HNH endonuclease n=1 Tax=unclassified Paraburkholderia TaxID=2615204 RepID=UPI0034CEB6FC
MEPLLRFLDIVSRGKREDRRALALLSSDAQRLFDASFDAVTKLAYGSSSSIRAHASLMAIVRILWNLAPVELFTQPSPNFKYLARRTIEERLSLGAGNEQLIRDLALVFKRIRFFYRHGRNTTSFDPSSSAQLSILHAQGWRCALCLFPFEDDLDLYAAEEESVVVDRHPAVENEIRLKEMYRRPELDHIIPHLLGGDDPENWQILCRSCNSGKSDAISGLSRHFSHSSVRTGDFSEFGASKRFAVVADYRSSSENLPVPTADQFLRVFRRNRSGFLNIENLCCELC